MEQVVSEREQLVREMERYLEQIAQGGDAVPSWSAAAVSPVKKTRRKVSRQTSMFAKYILRSEAFRFLYSHFGEQVLKMVTVVSILALMLVLTLETISSQRLPHEQMLAYDALLLALLLIEWTCRTLRLEFSPILAHAWIRLTFPDLGRHDQRRFTIMKIGLYFVDLFLIVSIVAYLTGMITVDPLTLSLIRLIRLVAIFRAFDLPLMRDLTAVLLAAFESIYLVVVAIGLHVFVFAVTGTVWFGTEAPQYFGNLVTSATTLVSPIVNGGAAPFIQEMCPNSKPDCLLRIGYFASFMWIGGVILLGLLTRLVQEKIALFKR